MKKVKRPRWSDKFAPGGTNVNFVQVIDNGLKIRTFEREELKRRHWLAVPVLSSAIAVLKDILTLLL